MVRNILLVEDDRGTSLVVKANLETKGYQVLTAFNGIEAVKILRVKSIDLIITDVVMPEMDGVDLYKAVKSEPNWTNIPIIIVTDKRIFIDSFSALGVNYFVEKTSNLSELIEKIRQVEKDKGQQKQFTKVLIGGEPGMVVESMFKTLQEKKCLVTLAFNTSEIITKALQMSPNHIILDVLYQDAATSYELVRALRCFDVLAKAKIFVYNHCFPGEMGLDVGGMRALEEQSKRCLDAGADYDIGRFNKSGFLEKLEERGF